MNDLNNLPEISGAGGGSSSPPQQTVVQNITIASPTRESVEEANNLFSVAFAKTVYAISEGEIEGFPNGATRDIFLDSTPIQNPDGSFNFTGYTIDSRTGTDETQTPMLGFSSTENTVGVNTAVTTAVGPITRSITDLDTERCRVIISHPALQSQNVDNGDIQATSVSYRISVSANGGPYTTVAEPTVSGKSSSQFQRAYEFALPGLGPWSIRVTRLTPDSSTVYLQNAISWQSYSEIVDEKFAYPNTALVGLKVDARQFTSIPDLSVRIRGKRVQIPTNYNPVTRVYTGIWDGTFTTAWTDNPAWIFRDIVLNPRFGCARYMPTVAIDPWYLYTVSQYCDEMVDNGQGGLEPRFTCNVYLQNPGGVYEVLNALASCFRGLVYYSQGKLYLTQDRQQIPVQQFSEANVIQEVDDNGNVTAPCFNYTGTAKTARKSVVLANWDDPNQVYSSVTEYLQDDQLLERFGYNPIDLRLVGVTSRGQALRAAKHTLFSNRYETEKVSFRIGAEGLAASVGEVIQIADPLKQGQRLGGRIAEIDGNSVLLDAVLNLDPLISYTLTLVIPDGETITNPDGSTKTAPKLATYNIVSYSSSVTTLELYELTTQDSLSLITQDGDIIGVPTPVQNATNTRVELDDLVDSQVKALWVLEWNNLQAALYKIIAIAEVDPLVFQVEAVQYNDSKYGYVDNDLPVAIPKDRFTFSTPQPVSNLAAQLIFNNNRTQISATWNVPQVNNADDLSIRNYRYQWREDSATQWGEVFTVTTTSASVSLAEHLFGNAYQFRVSTTDRLGRQSDFVTVDVAAFEPIPDLSDPAYNAVVRHANQPDGTQLAIVDAGTCPIPERITGYRIELFPVDVPTVIPGVKEPQPDGYYFYSDIPLTGYKTIAFHAPGDWRIRASFTSAIFGETPTDYIYHDIAREEIVPPTPSNFSVVENSDRSGKRFSWQLPLSEYGSWDQGVVSDIVGYEIRYKRGTLVGGDPSATWNVGIELASGGLPAQQQWFETGLFDTDEWVVMVKAVDVTQWRTDVPAYVLVNIGAVPISNAVQSIDASTSGTWDGDYVNCVVNGSDELEQIDAAQDSYFTWNFDNNNLESALLLSTTTNATYQHSLTALTGEDVILTQEDDGQLLQEDDDQIFGEQRYYDPGELAEGGILHPYAPYERLLGDVYRVQTLFKSPDGTTKGVITGLTAQLDYPDVIESINDAAISSSGAGTVINLTKTFRAISSVQVTLQNTSAITAVVLAKTTSAITVVCRDGSGTAVAGTVDLVVTGY
jgi:predicted phage tail protein